MSVCEFPSMHISTFIVLKLTSSKEAERSGIHGVSDLFVQQSEGASIDPTTTTGALLPLLVVERAMVNFCLFRVALGCILMLAIFGMSDVGPMS